MEFKKGYFLLEFNNQKDYGIYIYKMIIESKLNGIQYCGLTEYLDYIDIRERIKHYKHQEYEDWKMNLQPFIIIMRKNITENKKEYKKNYRKRNEKI